MAEPLQVFWTNCTLHFSLEALSFPPLVIALPLQFKLPPRVEAKALTFSFIFILSTP